MHYDIAKVSIFSDMGKKGGIYLLKDGSINPTHGVKLAKKSKTKA